MLQVMTNLAET